MLKRMCTARLLSVINKLFFADKTPIPWKVTMSIIGVMFFYASGSTIVFSFMPKLVKSFGTSEADTGYKVGLIAGSVFVGRLLCSLLWGYLADIYGKKNVTIVSGICIILTTLAFGFSFNVEWAIVTRFLLGMSMGLTAISKSLVMDICDDTNSSIGMTIILGSYSLGLIAGPAIGGILAFPGELYPAVFSKGSIFSRFGVLLPNMFVGIGLAVSLCFFFMFVPKDKVDEKINLHDKKHQATIMNNEQTFLIQTNIKKYNCSETTFDIKITKSNVKAAIKSKKYDFKESRFYRLLSNKSCMLLCVHYGIYSIHNIGINECVPLFAATSKEYNGFGFSTSQIGILLMIVSCFNILLEILIIPKIVHVWGLKKTFMNSSFLASLAIPLVPLCQLIKSKYLFWIVIVAVVLIIRYSISVGFLCVSVMLNNSVEPDLLGSANGLGVTSSTITRFIAVPVFGAMYSWSLKNIKNIDTNENALGFPFNQYFSFFVMSLLAFITALYTLLLPESLNQKLMTDPVPVT